MQLPPLERPSQLRPASAVLASSMVARGAAAAPVNPSVTNNMSVEPAPSVVNMVGLSNKSMVGEAVYTSVSDPGRRGSEAATAPKDWTIHRPVMEKVEDPLPVPLSKVLQDHVKSLWVASASAIQVHQVKNQQDQSQPNPNAASVVPAAQLLTYSLEKINKTEKS
jgi:hypothetical protein